VPRLGKKHFLPLAKSGEAFLLGLYLSCQQNQPFHHCAGGEPIGCFGVRRSIAPIVTETGLVWLA